MKMQIWAPMLNPLTHLGIISTTIEYSQTRELAPGLVVIELNSPSGQHFVFDASTGALLGRDAGLVLNDYNLLIEADPANGVTKLLKNRTELIQIREMKEGRKDVDRWEFFKLLHAA